MKEVSVIGGGISGLAAACYSAQSGHSVNVYEKNSSIGGRARLLEAEGFRFDMGPSWYWMPDIIENFFRDFGKSASDYYELIKLDPGFQIFFGKGEVLKVPAARQELYDLFESLEKGSAAKLKKFLSEGELKYRLGM